MIRHLAIDLAGGGRIVIQDNAGTGFFRQLADLLKAELIPGAAERPDVTLRTTADPVAAGKVVFSTPEGSLRFTLDDDASSLGVVVAPDRLEDDAVRIKIWRYLVICAGISAALRGIPAVLMHGAALLGRNGRAILLCAESGAGKSTTANRWQAIGGDFAADDMFILEYDRQHGSFFIHPLPTWSRCFTAPEAVRFPAGQPIPVAGILGLSRGRSGDVVERVSKEDFLGQILRAFFDHSKPVLKVFSPAMQQRFSRNTELLAGAVADAFPPCGLFADLKGDLKAAIADYLNNHAPGCR